jgi:acetoin utilization deacetylase AcuC-like enzyme
MLILVTDPAAGNHVAGPHHPESPQRLTAVLAGAGAPEIRDAIVTVEPRAASRDEVAAVHGPALLSLLDRVDGTHAQLDPDTAVSPQSVAIAMRAAGAGLTAVAALEAGEGEAAFCAVRPPGHHATPDRSMGFCLVNNVAVTAAALVARGERVVIADFDAHHGNGTQDVFWDVPDVLFVSWHQSPLYPGTGRLDETGGPNAIGRTVNVPLPPMTTGDSYRATFDEVVAPIVEEFSPTWLLVSAGFDAHRRDPITELGLSAGDFADLTAALRATVPSGRTVAFLEGGYDLEALEMSTTATMAALIGERVAPEPPTSGGAASERHADLVRAIERAQGRR